MHSADKKHGSKMLTKFNISRGLKVFCESTSLHGYSYLPNASSFLHKLFWMIVISIMTAVGTFLLVNNTKDYFKATIVTTIESSSAPLHVS